MIKLLLLLSMTWPFGFIKIEGINQTFIGEQVNFHQPTGELWVSSISCYPYSMFADGFEDRAPFTLRDGLGKRFPIADIIVENITYTLVPARPNQMYCFQGLIIEN